MPPVVPTDAVLVQRIRTGRRKSARSAADQLVSRHRPLVTLLINDYTQNRRANESPVPSTVDREDLIQVGTVAMLAVARDPPPRGWDPSHGVKFTSFARRRILWAVQDEIQRVPRAMTGIELHAEPEPPESEPPDVAPYLAELTGTEAALVAGVYGLNGLFKINPKERWSGYPGSIEDMAGRLGMTTHQAIEMMRSALAKMRALGYPETRGNDDAE